MTSARGLQRSVTLTRSFSALDLVATGVFAIQGAAAATHAGFDLLGVVVVGFMTALAGGIARDVLLGDLPPAALRSAARIITALAGTVVSFVLIGVVDAIPTAALTTLDAVGLALFAVTGAEKAVAHDCNLWVVAILGAVTAAGGGVVRDVLLGHVPLVLSESIYGTAALAGALLTGILLRARTPVFAAVWLGFGLGAGLRLAAVAWGWQLPRLA